MSEDYSGKSVSELSGLERWLRDPERQAALRAEEDSHMRRGETLDAYRERLDAEGKAYDARLQRLVADSIDHYVDPMDPDAWSEHLAGHCAEATTAHTLERMRIEHEKVFGKPKPLQKPLYPDYSLAGRQAPRDPAPVEVMADAADANEMRYDGDPTDTQAFAEWQRSLCRAADRRAK